MEILQLVPTSMSEVMLSSDPSNPSESLECCGSACCKDFEKSVSLLASPEFWLWLTIVIPLFIFFFAFTSTCAFYIFGVWRPVHPFLSSFSSGPIQTTEYVHGIIIPRLSYRNQNEGKMMSNQHSNDEILNVEELLSYIEDDSKIISEDIHKHAKATEIFHSSFNMESPVLTSKLHLSPSYCPTRQVAQVWDRGYQQRNFESIVFPPGFIDI